MFDDKPTDSNNKLPPNLPTSEPEDIFAGSDEDIKSEPETPKEQEEIQEIENSTPETALNAGALRAKAEGVSEEKPIEVEVESENIEPKTEKDGLKPIDHTKKVEMQTPPMQEGNTKNEEKKYEVKEPGAAKAIMIGSIIVIALIVLVGGAWWLYSTFITSTEKTEEDPFVAETTEPEVVEDVVVDETLPEDILDDELLFGGAVDSDGDGLDDIRESDIGTDPNNWDTDGDALSDYDEVTIWKTNPLDSDTDGDGYLDGAEVTAGFSPTGPGRLFDVTNLDSSNTSTK